MSTTGESATQPKKSVSIPTGPRGVLLAVGLVLIMTAPAIVLAFTPMAAAMGATIPGLLAASIGVLVGGVRRGLMVTVMAIVAVGLAPLGLLYPILGVLVITGLGVLVGYAAYRGMDQPVYTVNWLVAMTMLAPPALTASQLADGVTITPRYLGALVAVTAVGGLWAFLVMCLVDRRLPPRPVKRLPKEESIVYGATIAVLTGASAAVALTWFKYSLAGWVILTIYIISRPNFKGTDVVHGMRRKALQRAVGTVGGVIIASLIATFIHNPNVLLLIGALLIGPAMSRLVGGHPYWQYVALFTPAMVFLDSNGVHAQEIALERIVCTFIGLALAMLGLWFNRRFVFPWIIRTQQERAAASGAAAS